VPLALLSFTIIISLFLSFDKISADNVFSSYKGACFVSLCEVCTVAIMWTTERPSTYVRHSTFDIQHSLNAYSGARLSDIANFNIRIQISGQKYPFNNIGRHISPSGTAQTVAKPARLKPIGKCSYSIPRKDYLQFSILLQKHSSPGTIHLAIYK